MKMLTLGIVPRLVAVIALTIATPTLAGCGDAASSATGPLDGLVYSSGGGVHATTRPAEATLTVTPQGDDHRQAATVHTGTDGSFGLDLAPGSYQITGNLATPDQGGFGGLTTPQAVVITVGKTTHVNVYSVSP